MGSEIGLIDGIIVTPLKQIEDNRGAVFHILRNDSKQFSGFGEAYVSKINSGIIKAWKFHKEMTQNFSVPKGGLKLVVYDGRTESPTFGLLNEFFLDPNNNYKLITLPPQIWYGFQCISNEHCLLVNIANLVHNPSESLSEEISASKIEYNWNKK